MPLKAGKVWGQTELLLSNPTFEIHRIETKKGGFCSKHKHVHRYNAFYVESGTMEIHVWKNDYDLVDITTLNAGEICTVPPGEYHKFVSVTDCICFEIYYLTSIEESDIIRETIGGTEK